MKSFKERFTTTLKKEKDSKEEGKMIISEVNYLQAELMEALIKQIEHTRLSLK